MSEAEIKPFDAPIASAPNADDQIAGLQQQIQTLMIALLVTSGVMFVFIFQQMRYAIRDRDELAQAAQPVLQEKVVIDQFLTRACDFGKAHPDFMPILNKYQIPQAVAAGLIGNRPSPAPAPVITAPAAAPAPSPATKK